MGIYKAQGKTGKKPKPPPKRKPNDRRPKPDADDDRNQPCKRALAHKPHDAHIYRNGNQSCYCPGVQ